MEEEVTHEGDSRGKGWHMLPRSVAWPSCFITQYGWTLNIILSYGKPGVISAVAAAFTVTLSSCVYQVALSYFQQNFSGWAVTKQRVKRLNWAVVLPRRGTGFIPVVSKYRPAVVQQGFSVTSCGSWWRLHGKTYINPLLQSQVRLLIHCESHSCSST